MQQIPTPVGPALLHRDGPVAAPALLVLGHGAGGGVDAPDLLAARDAGLAAGLAVVRVEQPWRVAGRRVAEAPARLDQAFLAACGQLRLEAPHAALVLGGRSAGARVACRTAGALRAEAVVCLAFPLVTPAGARRAAELAAVAVPLLVVQGERDVFGVPTGAHVVAGADHGFAVRRRDLRTAQDVLVEVRSAVGGFLAGLGL